MAVDDADRGLAVLVRCAPVASDERVDIVSMEGGPEVEFAIAKLVATFVEHPLVKANEAPALEKRQIDVLRPPSDRETAAEIDDEAPIGLLSEADLVAGPPA